MTFPPFSFYPDKEVHVQITTNHWNSTRRNFVHEATVSWVENVNYQNFRVGYPLITRHKWFNFATLVTSSLEGWFLLKVVWISSRLITPFLRCSPNFFFFFKGLCNGCRKKWPWYKRVCDRRLDGLPRSSKWRCNRKYTYSRMVDWNEVHRN